MLQIRAMNVIESRDIDNSQSNSNVSCGRGFTTDRELILHLYVRRRKQQEQQNQQLEANDDQENTHRLQDVLLEPIKEPYNWNEKPGTTFINELNKAYDKIVYWRKNLFLPATGVAGKSFLNVMTRMINAWVYDT